MEVLVGSTFAIGVSSSPGAYGRDRSQDPDAGVPVSGTRMAAGSDLGLRLGGSMEALPEESTESSSSIGAPGDSDDDDEEDGEVVSSKADDGKLSRGFGSFGSLEEALPIKRGLSNHFTGKSKSFGNLSAVGSLKDVEKTENPFNKRRRVLIASRLSRKAFYSSSNPKSMPLFPVNEEDDGDDSEEQDEPSSSSSSSSSLEKDGNKFQFRMQQSMNKRKLGGLKSYSCFALSDLHEEEDEES